MKVLRAMKRFILPSVTSWFKISKQLPGNSSTQSKSYYLFFSKLLVAPNPKL